MFKVKALIFDYLGYIPVPPVNNRLIFKRLHIILVAKFRFL